MKTKLRKRILRNLKRAKETLDNMVENLETEEQDGMETGFAYLYQDSNAVAGDMQIVIDTLKDELREEATKAKGQTP